MKVELLNMQKYRALCLKSKTSYYVLLFREIKLVRMKPDETIKYPEADKFAIKIVMFIKDNLTSLSKF